MDKAQLERLTQLDRLAGGKETKRTPEEIRQSEASAARKYIVAPKVKEIKEVPPNE